MTEVLCRPYLAFCLHYLTIPNQAATAILPPKMSLQTVITFLAELLLSCSVLVMLQCKGELWYGGAPAVDCALYAAQWVKGGLCGQQVLHGGWRVQEEAENLCTRFNVNAMVELWHSDLTQKTVIWEGAINLVKPICWYVSEYDVTNLFQCLIISTT